MKKIIVLLSFIGLFSCSSDNEIKNEDATETNITNSVKSNNNINDDVDRMFYEYVNSTEYKDFNIALNSFYQKLNIDKSDIEFDMERFEVMEWIDLNLDNTDFISLDSASTEWQKVVNLKDAELKKFPQVKDFIVNNNEQRVLPYIAKWLNPNQNLANDVDCDKQFNDCNIWADSTFFSLMAANKHTLSPTVVSAINIHYMANLGICLNNFNDCIGL